MDSKTIKLLENFIREVVRDEISKSIPKKVADSKLSEMLGTVRKSIKKENKKLIEFSENPLLNDVLNQTAETMDSTDKYNLNEDISYSDNKEFESWPNMSQNEIKSRMLATRGMVVPDGMTADAIPEPVKKALTKDYSALMKKIKEKKGR